MAPVLQCSLVTDKNNTGSKGYAFVTLEDKGPILIIYTFIDGSVRKKVLSTTHAIKGKIVDLKLEDSNKKETDVLSVNKKVFVGGLEPTVDASK